MPSEPVAASPHDPRRDGDQSAVADDADDLSLGIHAADKLLHSRMASQLIRRPASRHDQGKEVIRVQGIDLCIRGDLQPVLAADRA